MVGKAMRTLHGWANYVNSWWLTLAAHISYLVEILVTVINWWSEDKHLAGHIFACCFALVPSLPSLVGFAIQSPLAVLLSWLTSTKEGSSLEYRFAWHQLRTPHHLHIIHITPLYSFEHIPSQTACAIRLLDWLDEGTSQPVVLFFTLHYCN